MDVVEEMNTLTYWYKRKEAELRALKDQAKPKEVSLQLLRECDLSIDKYHKRALV
jgi:hypothetical protein